MSHLCGQGTGPVECGSLRARGDPPRQDDGKRLPPSPLLWKGASLEVAVGVEKSAIAIRFMAEHQGEHLEGDESGERTTILQSAPSDNEEATGMYQAKSLKKSLMHSACLPNCTTRQDILLYCNCPYRCNPPTRGQSSMRRLLYLTFLRLQSASS
jgi:hypothetical protein